VRLGYRILRFGEFDEGGTENNLRATFQTPFEQVLGLVRYDIIKITSALITGFLSPEAEQFEYFRILRLKKLANGRCEVTAQAYNHTAYTAFETVTNHTAYTAFESVTTALPNPNPDPDPDPVPDPNPCVITLGTPVYDASTGFLSIPIPSC
jgi:hypothetical protein